MDDSADIDKQHTLVAYLTLQGDRQFLTQDQYLSQGNNQLREMMDKECFKMSACTIIVLVPMVYLVWIYLLRPLKTCLRLFRDDVSGSRSSKVYY